MIYKRFNNKVVLRLEIGEEVVSALTALMQELKLDAASVSGIGATDNITVGVYDPKSKVYTQKNILEDMEILSLSGNLTRKNGEPYIHIHGSFASLDGVYGGHINSVYISATAEIIIDIIDGNIERKFDEEIGLNLMEL